MTWLAIALLTALGLLGITLPWWSPRFMRPRGLARRSANVALYEERLAQLPKDVAAGTLPPDAVEELKAELGARLVTDAASPEATVPSASKRWVPIVAVVALGVLGIAWYALAGSWRTQGLIELSRTDPAAAEKLAVDQMLVELEAHVREKPDDAESWIWLGRTYRGRDRAGDAATAFSKASELKGHQDPDILSEWGEALAKLQDNQLAGAPAEKFEAALKLAPDHPRALWYAGAAAMNAGDTAKAVERWERLLKQELPDSLRTPLTAKVAELRERLGLPSQAAVPAGAFALKIEVTIAPELAQQVGAGDTLFVYAQDPSGPPMPLAVKRLPASALPKVTVELTDADSPMPTRKLSSVSNWRVVARVSKAGSAMPMAGDLETNTDVDRAAASKVIKLTIDRVRP